MSISNRRSLSGRGRKKKRKLFGNTLSADKRLRFYRRLITLLKNKVSPHEALTKLYESSLTYQSAGEKIFGSWKKEVYGECLGVIRSGGDISEPLKKFLPQGEFLLVKASLDSGELHVGLEEARKLLVSSRELKKTMKFALIVPTISFLGLCGFLVFFSLNIIPKFSEFMPPSAWTGAAKYLYLLSIFIKDYGIMALLFIVAFFAIIGYSVPRATGKFRDRILNKLPPWSLYQAYTVAVFFISLSSMMKNGLNMNDSLVKIRKLSSKWSRQHIDKMLFLYQRGKKDEVTLRSEMIPREYLDDLSIYSGSSSFEEGLHIMGEEMVEQTLDNIKGIMPVINTMIVLLVAIVVIWIAGSLYPMFTEMAKGASSVGV